jgi:hypothetical protein
MSFNSLVDRKDEACDFLKHDLEKGDAVSPETESNDKHECKNE